MTDTSSTAARNVEQKESGAFEARALMASLTVKNLQASLAWYRDVLGFGAGRRPRWREGWAHPRPETTRRGALNRARRAAGERGARVFRLHDPDGFKLVISSERKR